jgi:outer membrane protein assembly factor BamB
MRTQHYLILVALLSATPLTLADDWRAFRGPEGSSTSTSEKSPPDSFDVKTGENVAWTSKLPGRGVSGPVIAGDRVFVTSSSGVNRDRLHVVGLDAKTGKQLWHREFWSTGRTLCHPSSANAAPTPATDGERVFAFYSSNDLACFDRDGNMLWYRGLAIDHPGVGNDVGMASSPVVVGDVVVVQAECQANSFAAAYDRQTGEERWSLERPAMANWASPIAIEVEADGESVPAVVLQSSKSVAAYAAEDGRVLWEVPMGCGSIPSAAAQDGIVYVPGNGITAIATAVDHEGDRKLWSDNGLKCGNPSPIVCDAGLLFVNSAGVLACVSPEDQKSLWKKRLGGKYWGTPVVAGNRLYALSDAGEVIIVDLSEGAKGKIVNKCSLGEGLETLSSPAVADGALYLRSVDTLWKIAPK